VDMEIFEMVKESKK